MSKLIRYLSTGLGRNKSSSKDSRDSLKDPGPPPTSSVDARKRRLMTDDSSATLQLGHSVDGFLDPKPAHGYYVGEALPVEGFPYKDTSLLSGFSASELERFCRELSVDYSHFPTPEFLRSWVPVREELRVLAREYNMVDALQKKVLMTDHKTNLGDRDVLSEAQIDKLFLKLLAELDVPEEIVRRVTEENPLTGKMLYPKEEKYDVLGVATSIFDKEHQFVDADYKIIQYLHSLNSVDSLRLLILKFRLQGSTASWRQSFYAAGGIQMLCSVALHRVEQVTFHDLDAATLEQIVNCFLTVDIDAIINTPNAINSICQCIDFQYHIVALLSLELLSKLVTFGGEEALWQVRHGIHALARRRKEKPYAVFAAALIQEQVDVQVAVVAFLNSLLAFERSLDERLTVRNFLKSSECIQAMNFLVNTSHSGSIVSLSDSVKAEMATSSAESEDTPSRKKALGLMDAYSLTFGSSFQAADDDMGPDEVDIVIEENGYSVSRGKVPIWPRHGEMAGWLYIKKKEKERDEVKMRICHLTGEEFKWYHQNKIPDTWDTRLPENNMLPINEVLDVKAFCVTGLLQENGPYGFMIDTNSWEFNIQTDQHEFLRLQMSTEEQKTQRQWVVALRTAQSIALTRRCVYKLSSPRLTIEDKAAAGNRLLAQIEVFRHIISSDIPMMIQKLESADNLSPRDWFGCALNIGYMTAEAATRGHAVEVNSFLERIGSLCGSSASPDLSAKRIQTNISSLNSFHLLDRNPRTYIDIYFDLPLSKIVQVSTSNAALDMLEENDEDEDC